MPPSIGVLPGAYGASDNTWSSVTTDWHSGILLAMQTKTSLALGRNVQRLREERGLTQQQASKLAGVPRTTWSNMESGEANPTLTVLERIAGAFQITLEELVAPPKHETKVYPRGSLPRKQRGAAFIDALLPDPIPGVTLERFELAPLTRITGVPHLDGTREYLALESGTMDLVTSGQTFALGPGDVAVFRGDQRHSYANTGRSTVVAYSVVLLARA
jgi:XRE family transcriptional regulator, regulator of sulfur utilization